MPKDRDYWRLATIEDEGRAKAALVVGTEAFALDEFGVSDDVLGLLRRWDEALSDLDQAFAAARACETRGAPLKRVRFLAPIPTPAGLFCAGANYYDHIKEMSPHPDPKPPQAPFFFLKSPAHCVVGPKAAVALPEAECGLDWEAEIAVVIGKRARHVREADALAHVAGYTILNDLSARLLMKRGDTSFTYDWIGQKVFPGSAPMGPWLTPASLVPNPQNLSIKLWLNDEIQQDSSSEQMVFSVAEQIAYLSRRVELQPGDVIATGTPAGCGWPRREVLKPGDCMRIEIEALGALETSITAPVTGA